MLEIVEDIFLSPKVRLFIDQLKDYVGKPPHWDNFCEFKKLEESELKVN